MTVVVGLTGGIATGKSTVAQILRGLSIPVIDADQVARAVTSPSMPALVKIRNYFGQQAILPSGSLNRQWLGQRVFANPAELKILTAITAPYIEHIIHAEISNYQIHQVPLIILDAPLLFEQGYQAIVDLVMVVAVPPEEQLSRLMRRNQLTRTEAQLRIDSQMPLTDKIERADVVINNAGDVAETKRQVVEWLEAQSLINIEE